TAGRRLVRRKTGVRPAPITPCCNQGSGAQPGKFCGISAFPAGPFDYLNFFRISGVSQEEKSKQCRICGIRGASSGPLRYHSRKEGPFRGEEEEGSGQEEEISEANPAVMGALRIARRPR